MKFPWWFLWPRHDELMAEPAWSVRCFRPGCTYSEPATDDAHARLLSEEHMRTAHSYRPKLVVRRAARGWWSWWVQPNEDGPIVGRTPQGLARTHAEALAVGLAALDTATVRSGR